MVTTTLHQMKTVVFVYLQLLFLCIQTAKNGIRSYIKYVNKRHRYFQFVVGELGFLLPLSFSFSLAHTHAHKQQLTHNFYSTHRYF